MNTISSTSFQSIQDDIQEDNSDLEIFEFPQLSDVTNNRENLRKELYKRYIDAPWSWTRGIESRLPNHIREKMNDPLQNSRSRTANVLMRDSGLTRVGSGFQRITQPRIQRPHTVHELNNPKGNFTKSSTRNSVLFETDWK